MATVKHHQQVLHVSAAYYEALLRARFVRSMKRLQQDTSIHTLATHMSSTAQAMSVIPREKILKAMAPLKQVLIDAYMRGGKIGAEHVKEVLTRG